MQYNLIFIPEAAVQMSDEDFEFITDLLLAHSDTDFAVRDPKEFWSININRRRISGESALCYLTAYDIDIIQKSLEVNFPLDAVKNEKAAQMRDFFRSLLQEMRKRKEEVNKAL